MSRYATTLLLAFSLPAVARALPDWTWTDTLAEVAVVAAAAADWSTTLDLKNHPGHTEINPILGQHPTDGQIHTYFLGYVAAHFIVARLLPRPWRSLWQGASIGVSLTGVHNNLQLGLSFRLP